MKSRPRRLPGLAAALSACLLALSAAPAEALGRTPADPVPRFREYVALGDSWHADVSLTDYTTEHVPSGCAQSRWDYPHQVAKRLRVPVFRDATCGGATTRELRHAQDVNRIPGLYDGVNKPQFDRLTRHTDLVTFGIGGNDSGLSGAAAGCVNLLPELRLPSGLALPAPLGRPCRHGWVRANGTDLMGRRIAQLTDRVTAAVQEIKKRSPKATVLVVDYLAGAPTDHGCFPYQPVHNGDLKWIGRQLGNLNAMLREAARRAGERVRYVDTYSGSVGHDVCELPGTNWVEGVLPLSANPPGLAVPFHPNRLGADHQARTVLASLGA